MSREGIRVNYVIINVLNDEIKKEKNTTAGNTEKLLCLRLRYRKFDKSANSAGRVAR